MPETTKNNKRDIIEKCYRELHDRLVEQVACSGIPFDSAQDLVQEVFLKLMGVDLVRPDQIKSLVAIITYQKRYDWFRRRAEQHRRTGEMVRAESYNDSTLAVKELRQAEQHAISRLKAVDARIYRLGRFTDLSTQEIADKVQLTGRAVESRFYRARVLVRKELEEFRVAQ